MKAYGQGHPQGHSGQPDPNASKPPEEPPKKSFGDKAKDLASKAGSAFGGLLKKK
jgi:hypothetical protein